MIPICFLCETEIFSQDDVVYDTVRGELRRYHKWCFQLLNEDAVKEGDKCKDS